MSATQETISKNSPSNIAESLKKGASQSKDVYNVCMVFAMRERTRFEVNVQSLKASMASEGYEMTTGQIESVLIFFASLGIGKLTYDGKKRLKGLVEVKWTLQSIGQAALGSSTGVSKSAQQRKYTKLVDSAPISVVPNPSTPPKLPTYTALISTKVNGRDIKLPLELTADGLLELMAQVGAGVFNGRQSKKGQQ